MTALFEAKDTTWQPCQTIGGVPPGVLLAAARLSDDAILIAVDHSGALAPIWTNPALDRVFGFPPDHLQATGALGWELDDSSPGRAEATQLLLSSLRDARGGATEVALKRTDGSSFFARVTLAPV